MTLPGGSIEPASGARHGLRAGSRTSNTRVAEGEASPTHLRRVPGWRCPSAVETAAGHGSSCEPNRRNAGSVPEPTALSGFHPLMPQLFPSATDDKRELQVEAA